MPKSSQSPLGYVNPNDPLKDERVQGAIRAAFREGFVSGHYSSQNGCTDPVDVIEYAWNNSDAKTKLDTL